MFTAAREGNSHSIHSALTHPSKSSRFSLTKYLLPVFTSLWQLETFQPVCVLRACLCVKCPVIKRPYVTPREMRADKHWSPWCLFLPHCTEYTHSGNAHSRIHKPFMITCKFLWVCWRAEKAQRPFFKTFCKWKIQACPNNHLKATDACWNVSTHTGSQV